MARLLPVPPPLDLDLDAPISKHFCLRDLIECGSTWHRFAAEGKKIDNLPREIESVHALERLAQTTLDPVVEEFGGLELTYGFATPRLTKHIKRHICPGLDQHAAHELNRVGKPVCSRGGAACDFRVVGVDVAELVEFIRSGDMFDRLYIYDRSSRIHVAAQSRPRRHVVHLSQDARGRRIPRLVAGRPQAGNR